MYTGILGPDGWVRINKEKIGYTDYVTIRNKLMDIQPHSSSKNFKRSEITLYRESKNWMILPREYGMNVIGQYKLNYNYLDKKCMRLGVGVDMKNKYELIDVELYPYQRKACDSIIDQYKSGILGGILKLPTGSGKTLTSLEIARGIGKKCLIVVKVVSLANQWMGEINKLYKKNLLDSSRVVILSDIRDAEKGKRAIADNDFIICVRNTLMGNKYSWRDFIDVGMVIVDEIHSMMSENVLGMFKRISRRFILGITATPKILSGLHTLMGFYVGRVLYSFVNSYTGASPKVFFINYKSKIPNEVKTFKHGPNANKVNYIETYKGVLADIERTNMIISLVHKCMNDPSIKKIILLAQFRSVLDELYEKLSPIYNTDISSKEGTLEQSTVGLYYAVSGKEAKRKQVETLTNAKLILAITSLGKESLNIVDCNCLILTTSIIIHKDSENTWNCQAMEQVMGRCLRRQWSEQFAPHIYVINDMFSFFLKHWRLRKTYFIDICGKHVKTIDQKTLT